MLFHRIRLFVTRKLAKLEIDQRLIISKLAKGRENEETKGINTRKLTIVGQSFIHRELIFKQSYERGKIIQANVEIPAVRKVERRVNVDAKRSSTLDGKSGNTFPLWRLVSPEEYKVRRVVRNVTSESTDIILDHVYLYGPSRIY
ncbi:uncharacterized protein LOC143154081 [Ptiloglossa arizonensis]|uniref:uncharacterized protein LOC143154081 n=1 Tax=Ptiloglossa arizonensis TaxID=3350558 RepID=UPI003FA08E34